MAASLLFGVSLKLIGVGFWVRVGVCSVEVCFDNECNKGMNGRFEMDTAFGRAFTHMDIVLNS